MLHIIMRIAFVISSKKRGRTLSCKIILRAPRTLVMWPPTWQMGLINGALLYADVIAYNPNTQVHLYMT